MTTSTAYAAIHAVDPESAGLIAKEAERQRDNLCLIASENYTSPAVMAATGSVLTNRYSEGYPGRRYYTGQKFIDEVEILAIERAKTLFGAEHVNVQPLSGAPANLAVYLAFLKPGETTMGMNLTDGGHLTHGYSASMSGRFFRAVHYGVSRATGRIDYDEVRDIALRERPKLIWAGGTAVPRVVDFRAFAEISREVGAHLIADVAHTCGLIAGGVYPSPVGLAQVVTTTTNKTLRGPRGGMILCKSEHARAINAAVFPGMQGGPFNHKTVALAVALKEASQPSFRRYAEQVVRNAQALSDALLERGFNLVTGGTDTHLILCDLTNKEISGKRATTALERAGISANFNAVPFDVRKPTDPSGIRFGTAASTTRGMTEVDMRRIAAWIDAVIRESDNTVLQDRISGEVKEMCAAFPVPSPQGLVG